jgi:DNA-binding transcriptional ArsR family regulator
MSDTSQFPDPASTKYLDPASVRALAHPLRIRMLGRLRLTGPATSAQLAREFDENTGATSYHLRQLERHGFVAEDPTLGSGRERWWRALQQNTSWQARDFIGDEESLAAADVISRTQLEGEIRRVQRWFADRAGWSPDWLDAATSSDLTLRLSTDRLRAMTAEVYAVLARYRTEQPGGPDATVGAVEADGTEPVAVYFRAFPTRTDAL